VLSLIDPLTRVNSKNKLFIIATKERFVFISRSRVLQHHEYQIDRSACWTFKVSGL